MVAILAWLQNISWYLLTLGFFAAIVLILVGINQYSIFKERRKKRFTQYSDKEIETTIRDWVDLPTFSFQRQERPEVYFQFLITDIYKRLVTIARHKNEPYIINILTELELTPTVQQVTKDGWEKLASRLSVEMARLGIQFKFNGETNKLDRIRLWESVSFDDSLTAYYFRERILFVIRAFVLVEEVRRDFFREIATVD